MTARNEAGDYMQKILPHKRDLQGFRSERRIYLWRFASGDAPCGVAQEALRGGPSRKRARSSRVRASGALLAACQARSFRLESFCALSPAGENPFVPAYRRMSVGQDPWFDS